MANIPDGTQIHNIELKIGKGGQIVRSAGTSAPVSYTHLDVYKRQVFNSTKGKKERIGRILQMHANTRKEIDMVYAGDIAAAVGLKDTTTGDTLCDEKMCIRDRNCALWFN